MSSLIEKNVHSPLYVRASVSSPALSVCYVCVDSKVSVPQTDSFRL